ncbi:hypothetical protein [Amycolatopsis nigrescens]|uniref:hypothetical protein n=1 Tax=Amycolatopsis nigrescens TaxID=381445 RepID=UPI00037C8516|nr:hypothetical protein [Amycolatopsis nigrescens]
MSEVGGVGGVVVGSVVGVDGGVGEVVGGVQVGRSERVEDGVLPGGSWVPGCWGGGPCAGGGSTEVVGSPSSPMLTTVVGVAEVDEGAVPATAAPLIVIGPPGTPLPGTSCGAGEPARLGGALASELPCVVSSATAAKAVASTRPLAASST